MTYFALLLLFSYLVMYDSLQPCELQNARLPYPSLSPRVCSNSCPLNRWCQPTISSSAFPFSSYPQPFPASGSFPMSLLFAFSSVQFSRSVVSNSLWPHESQHTRPPCPSPTPRIHSDSLPSSQWCHPAISSSVVPFSSCPRSLPASGSFSMSQLFTWGGQIGQPNMSNSLIHYQYLKYLICRLVLNLTWKIS